MINNLIKSVLHVVGAENMLRPNELETIGTKTIAELLDEEKKTKEDTTEKISERS
jgi:hypothetical protein